MRIKDVFGEQPPGEERGHGRQRAAPLNPTVATLTAFPNSAAFPSRPAAEPGVRRGDFAQVKLH